MQNTLTKEAISNSHNYELNSSKNNVTSTTIHTVFLRDSLSSIKIEGAEFGNFQGNDKVKKDAEKAFNKIVPEQFRGFVSSFMMQGGISNLFFKNISNSDVKTGGSHPSPVTGIS